MSIRAKEKNILENYYFRRI